MTITLRQRRNLEIIIITTLVLVSFFFWDSIFVYPIKLFVVLSHEMMHAIAAMVTGGEVEYITITENLGGQTAILGGNKFLIASAGYIGSLFAGAVLFISAYDKKHSVWAGTLIGILLILCAANLIAGALGLILSVVFALILIISPRLLPAIINALIFKTLGMVSVLYAVIDIKEDLLTTEYTLSDAQILANITGIPAILWGIIWFVISALIIFLLIRFGIRKGFRS